MRRIGPDVDPSPRFDTGPAIAARTSALGLQPTSRALPRPATGCASVSVSGQALGLARGGDRAAGCLRGGAQSLVVGDDAGEVAAELVGAGKVDRVERAKLRRQQ